MTFERRLARTLQHLLLGSAAVSVACGGGAGGGSGSSQGTTDTGEPGTTPPSLCDTVTTTNGYGGDYSREPGYLSVPVGEPCPVAPAPSELTAADCCPVLDPQEVCGLVAESTGTRLPYVYQFSTDTGAREPATFCEYDTVFEVGGGCCGRPLRLGGQSVVACVEVGPGWAEPVGPLDGPAAAVAYWEEVAQLEHASVASFGRVALELMRFGAPSDLVRRAHEAALDEVRHAELAFGLVSALRGVTVGPGPLPLPDGLPLASTLAEVAEGVVREGCIGETLAAADAVARLRGADGAVADVLATIADDEARHAGLAWAMLRWLVEVGGDEVRDRAEAVFAEGVGVVPALSEVPRGGRARGLIDDGERRAVTEQVWATVIAPSWAALRQGQPDSSVLRSSSRST